MTRDARVHLASTLSRVLRWQPEAVVRVITRMSSLGLYAELPTGVLVFVALPVEAPVPELDASVSAHRLRDVLGDPARAGADVHPVRLPDGRTTPPALAALPPRDRWILGERATAGDVLAAFERRRAVVEGDLAALPEGAPMRAEVLRSWRAEPCWGGMPTAAVEAARSFGMLGVGPARVESGTCAGWKRLASPAGQVFTPPPDSHAQLNLSVV
ncbi:MAG: hypothetical protein RLZ55_1132 [Actinomycetota bacterium]